MMNRFNACFKVLLCVTSWLFPNAKDAQAQSDALVTIESGDLPIILSAPHGGRSEIPGVPKRRGDGIAQFKTATDTRTNVLAGKLADALEKRLGKRPYTVIAGFHRQYLDANRPPKNAYESEAAKATYDRYHKALAAARQDVVDRWGSGILLDIHGQASQPKSIIRGTQNGKTTSYLVGRFGRQALTGENSLFGRIAENGFAVIPEVGSANLEHPKYDGGHIVNRYGSGPAETFDAIQLEVGIAFRSTDQIPATADKLATAICSYAKDYLPESEMATRTGPVHNPPSKIQVGVYCDQGSGRSLNDLMASLQSFKDVRVTKLTAEQIRRGDLKHVDVLIHPGGSGGTQGRHLQEEGRVVIRDFIQEGGGFIGICAGAYLASADYDWSLHVLDAKVIDRKHWARGKGTVTISLNEDGRDRLDIDEEQLQIYYGQGPLLAPGNHPQIADYQPLATFSTEIAQKGAPKGVMIGTTAIARGRYGDGRVLCFSPHPEMTDGLESLVLAAINEVRRVEQSESRHDGSVKIVSP